MKRTRTTFAESVAEANRRNQIHLPRELEPLRRQVPREVWERLARRNVRIGGGAVLAADEIWNGHRGTLDIDIHLLPEDFREERDRLMEGLGKTFGKVETIGSPDHELLIRATDEGQEKEIQITNDYLGDFGYATWQWEHGKEVAGTGLIHEHPAMILWKKLEGRGAKCTARDVYDVAWAIKQSPRWIAQAWNRVDRYARGLFLEQVENRVYRERDERDRTVAGARDRDWEANAPRTIEEHLGGEPSANRGRTRQ